ncbi:MAG: tyrosine--tRNA ligase [Acidobacteria bacterium 13_2_20CM_2_57_6]|nr:MAG: tyrosine--tRNA ligase [Acidobacteria bacterium 13_2_20CM_2_57_6]PYT57594.1 MAG: tyrosine--tRNA ligase [Acidobacteriota bacterium]
MTPAKFKPVEEQLAYLKKGVAEIIPEAELKAKLEQSLKTGKPLRVYLGVDPTAPDLHLGHTVVLRKLKHFQYMGHTAVFLIGDFSAMIGDPTGVSETRPPLTREQVDANAKTYLAQVYKILDKEKTEVRYNSEWLSKMSAEDIVRLCSHYRLARMLEREDFRSRLDKGQPISVHELLYPLLTAIDAVKLQSDVELGATEQKFNLLVHREIQREYGLPGQAILTMPILVGLDGQRKMSKSLGNYVGITEAPGEIFGKMMSIPDELMWSYYELLTDRTPQEIVALKQEVAGSKLHPMDAKMRLAEEVISDFHGQAAARKAAENFQRVFRDRQAPVEAPVVKLPKGPAKKLAALLVDLKLAPSKAEGERLIKQGGVEIDEARIDDPRRDIDLSQPLEFLLRAGKKKFLRIVIE